MTAEFYQMFWSTIGEFIVNVFNYCYDRGHLTDSQSKSVFSLIYKKGERENIKNYRPISITNIDYKIIAFVLANRLHKVMHKIVNKDQTGYIKKRYIGQNIRLVQDVVHYAKTYKQNGIVLFLDFEKAFDSIEWNFIYCSLEKFNFGNGFITWIKTLYSNPKACIKNNGWTSDGFNLQRGIRQSCPVSALLFTLAVEILACRLRTSVTLNGYTLKANDCQRSIKISQYADDTQLYIKDVDQIPIALSILKTFSEYAGPKLNITKTEGLWLDNHFPHEQTIHGIRITVGPIKCLGIYVGGDAQICNKLNWNGPIENMELLLNTWKKRDLTLFGKITVIKSLAISKLNHQIMNCQYDDDIIKRINKILYGFIWGKIDRIKRNTLICNIQEGGLNMIDIESHIEALNATWIERILN